MKTPLCCLDICLSLPSVPNEGTSSFVVVVAWLRLSNEDTSFVVVFCASMEPVPNEDTFRFVVVNVRLSNEDTSLRS